MTDYDEQNNITSFPKRNTIGRDASKWVTLRDHHELTSEERAAFEQWKSTAPEHEDVLNEAEAVWIQLDRLSELKGFTLPPELHTENLAADEPRALPRVLTRRSGLMAIAASMALFITSAILLQAHLSASVNQHETFATDRGEQETVTMADGSTAILNTMTVLEIDYTRSSRLVRLKSGEAYFDVEHDPKRPFIVVANKDAVRAVGTAFSVYIDEGATEVTVTEGRVALLAQTKGSGSANAERELDSSTSFSSPIIEVSAGHNATLRKTETPTIVSMSLAELERKLSWRSGLLSFAGAPLTDVVSQITRYADYKIEIADPSIVSLPIGGSFRVGDIDEFLLALEGTFDIQVERVTENHVRLRRAV